MRRAVPPSFNVEFMTAATAAARNPRPSRPKGARRSCGCTSFWPTSSRASPRSIFRSASRSTRFRRSSARCCRRISNDFGRYPANKGTERLPQGRRGLARPALPARPAGRSRDRSPRAQRHARGPVPRRARRQALCAGSAPGKPAILIPNPFYAAYSAGAAAADCEPVYLPTTRETGFLPDLDAHRPTTLLARTVAFYLASPSNPQGAVADDAYLTRLVALARRFGFLIFADECYCEIYLQRPRAARHAAKRRRPDFANVVVFHSLSKRSNLPGLRVGFAAGDRRFLAPLLELRNVAAPQVPVPAQEVAIAAYGDEAHVEENRALYRREIRSRRPDHRRPLRLPASGRRLLPLARRDRAGRRRGGRRVKLWRDGGPARHSRPLSRARRRRRPQSRRRLHPRRAGSGQGNHRRGAAPPRRRARLSFGASY